MKVESFDGQCVKALLDEDLYVWAAMLSGLKSLDCKLVQSLLIEGGLCRDFEKRYGLTSENWMCRRTSRVLDGSRLNKFQRSAICGAVDFVSDHLKSQSAVRVRVLLSKEMKVIKKSLASQAEISGDVVGIGFFHTPSSYMSVRENWVAMGVIAQLMCVLAHKVSTSVFLSHGLEQSSYEEVLSDIEYVLIFGG